ncbi:esterase FE4-like [Trichoplusia ni]|uniref:Carboxylic ester hydrolase n=1 Tax=Trichoplusia ni TaxID=7111 RepID=A0A7E5WUD2_TRINI|nr:esterase FE4-like [Trichoplusia ni]
MKCAKLLVLLWCAQCVRSLFVRTPVVQVSQGALRGRRGLSGQNRYYGIPYAVSERFQPPKPPRKWNGIFEAVSRFDSCAQAFAIFKLGSENCLVLDVYTPGQAIRGQKLPVLVFFHGGAYYYGSKWHYDPEFLVKKNVIVATVNYRVGALGFLCLNNVANLGLKDQVAALKWIKKNIAAFGGDPDNVTVSGHSAGSTAAGMHLLSRQSAGLFHKAILMSGVFLSPWAFNCDPLTPAVEDAAKISTVRSDVDVYNTFMNTSVNDILTATLGTSIDPKYFKYSPCMDRNFTDPFFHDTPYNVITSGDFNKVPMIVGFTDLEGFLFYALNNQRTLEYLDNNFADSLPSVFSWCSKKDKRIIADKIRSHYFGKQRISSKATIKGAVDFYSDWIAYASVDAFSRLMAKYSGQPVYNYMFSYEGGRNYAKAVFNRGIEMKGVLHSDDIFYLFKPGGFTLRLSDPDKLLIERYTTMLTNFMKFGDPTPVQTPWLPVRWAPTTAARAQVLHVDRRLSVSDMPASHRGQFLLQLLCRHGLSGYVPCQSEQQCNRD